MTITEQQEIAKEVLKRLSINVDSSAVIAGGAPRNWDQNTLARDVDIYFRSYVSDIKRMLDWMFNDGSGDFQFIDAPDTNISDVYVESMVFNIRRVISVTYKGVLFQFICVDEKEHDHGCFGRKIINSFLVNISKIYMIYLESPDRLFKITCPAYQRDVQNNTLTVEISGLSGIQFYRGIQNYLPKIQSYYPNHTVIFKE